MKHSIVTAAVKWVPNCVRLLCGGLGGEGVEQGMEIPQIHSPFSQPVNHTTTRLLDFDQMV